MLFIKFVKFECIFRKIIIEGKDRNEFFWYGVGGEGILLC